MSSACDYMEDYKPFLSQGFICLDENSDPKPLHRIYLKSDLITGPVVVGVLHNLPVEGVLML